MNMLDQNPSQDKAQIVYFSHGGGPLPILGDASHQAMVDFMCQIPKQPRRPDVFLVIIMPKNGMLNRFCASYNCCDCCCGATGAHQRGTLMLAFSDYVAAWRSRRGRPRKKIE